MPKRRFPWANVPEYRLPKAPRVAMDHNSHQRSESMSYAGAMHLSAYDDPTTSRPLAAARQEPQQPETDLTRYKSETTFELVARTRHDPELAALVQAVTANKGTPDQIARFNAQVREINSILAAEKRSQTHNGSFTGKPAKHGRSFVPLYDDTTDLAPRPTSSKPAPKSMRSPPRVHRPVAKYSNHPDSGVGSNFHGVPYPMSLLPLQTWKTLHNNSPEGAVCSSCHRPRLTSIHQRKMFLVAERLAWSNDTVSSFDRSQNEEALWSVNAELEIYEPAVEDDVIAAGGTQSHQNEWFPFHSEGEADVVLRVISRDEKLSEQSWSVWRHMLDDRTRGDAIDAVGDINVAATQRPPLGGISGNSRWLPSTEHMTKVKGKDRAIIESIDLSSTHSSLPTPPSSGPEKTSSSGSAVANVGNSMRSLRDFYIILDKLERTSPMGAKFLEAYAERLRDEVCKDCWFKSNVLSDDALVDPAQVVSRPSWTKTATPLLASSVASTRLSR